MPRETYMVLRALTWRVILESGISHNTRYAAGLCTSNIEMTPLCKVEVTLPRVLGSRGMGRGGGVDEQAGVQPA